MVWLLDPNKLLPLLVTFWSVVSLSQAVRRWSDLHYRQQALDLGLAAGLALLVTLVSPFVIPKVAGLAALSAWIFFVVGPNVTGRVVTRRAAARDYRGAELLCSFVGVIRPFGQWRELATLLRALRWLSEGQRNAGLGLLAQLAQSGGELSDDAELEQLTAEQRWEDIYEHCHRQRRMGPMPLVWLPRFLRSMGEMGRVPELVMTTSSQAGPLFASPPVLPHALLVTFAFAGRVDLVRQVLDESLRYLDVTSREAWLGTAELVGGDPAAGRQRLEACSHTADAPQLAAIQRRLAVPPPRAEDSLDEITERQIAKLAAHWQTVKRFVPGHGIQSLPWATLLITGLMVVVFGLEEALGGSMNPGTLELVGALDPERVMAGQWWRIFTALFIHMGSLHLIMNATGLIALGAFVERRFGALRLTVLFLASGALPMLTHVLLTPVTGATTSVGASGGVMGLAGAMIALLGQGYFERGVPETRRYLRLLVTLVVIQTSFDLLVPVVDFLGHSLGLATGFTLGAIFCGMKGWRVALVGTPACAFALGMQLSLHHLPWRTPPCSDGETALCEQLCEMDFNDACDVMGHKYLEGEDVEKDPVRARAFFKSACRAQMGDACALLGELVYRGEGGRRDREAGVELVWRGCRLKSDRGCKLLDHLCEAEHEPTACAHRTQHRSR